MKHFTIILCLLLALSSFAVIASTVYVAQANQGTGSGVDAANAKQFVLYSQNGADTVHLVGTFFGPLTFTVSGSSAVNRFNIIFEPNAVITTAAANGIVFGNNNYITIDGGVNGLIQCTANGTSLANQNSVSGISGTPSIGITIQNVTMTNLFVHTPGDSPSAEVGSGIFLSGVMTNIDIHGCNISQIQHGVLLNYQPGFSTNLNVNSNTLTYCSWGIGVGAGNAGAVLTTLNEIGNHITGQSQWNTANNHYHENGIYDYTDPGGGVGITNITVSGNIIGPDLGGNATAAIFFSSDANTDTSGIWNVNIFNNTLYTATAQPGDGLIYCFDNCFNVLVANNTMDGGSTAGFTGMTLAGNNTVSFYNNIVANIHSATYCPSGGFTTGQVDYNLYYNVTYWGNNNPWTGGGFSWLTYWGFDAHGVYPQNPNYVNGGGYDFHITGSNNVGTNLTAIAASLGIPRLLTDKDGNARPSVGAWDAGAYQYVAPVVVSGSGGFLPMFLP